MNNRTILDYLSFCLLIGFAVLGLIVSLMNLGHEATDTSVIYSPVGKLFWFDTGSLILVLSVQAILGNNKKQ